MLDDQASPSSDAIQFLQNQAPMEFERLQSIAGLVTATGTGVPGGQESVDLWYAMWVKEAIESRPNGRRMSEAA